MAAVVAVFVEIKRKDGEKGEREGNGDEGAVREKRRRGEDGKACTSDRTKRGGKHHKHSEKSRSDISTTTTTTTTTHLRYPSGHDGARVHHRALLTRRQPRRHRKHHPKHLAQECFHAHLLCVEAVLFRSGRQATSADRRVSACSCEFERIEPCQVCRLLSWR